MYQNCLFLNNNINLRLLKVYFTIKIGYTVNAYVRTVNFLQILMFIRVIWAHYGVSSVTFSTTPYKINNILLYSLILLSFK